MSVQIEGVAQGIVITGADPARPVLLWVHGGPGMPDYVLTDGYPPALEDLFTVAWWDQRGAGLSYDPAIPPESMTIEQFVEDTLAVTDYLRERFDQDRIFILGHSWGSFIAIQAAARSPERYRAYIGMAQVVHQIESEEIAYDYMLDAYRARGNRRMVRALEAAPVTASGTPAAYLRLRDKAMHGLGVGTTRHMRSVVTGIFLRSVGFRGYSVREKVDLWRGRAFSRSFGLWEQFIHIDLRERVPSLEVPAYFLEGRFDYTCVTALAEDYLRRLAAPVKGLYVFGDSAHSPVLEQPELAHRILATDVLNGTTSLADLR
ncbi:alpha/beta hydrolase [Nocardioides sp. GY 10113]|uniref:alpha/beta fold hydrolase n=1 Tax=Nocardioides sp. GY 10113 TaxID=2569761 RepID=UPI0014588C62|nr:alpha/beta hydrolase [Nocardioides sp. GY 10113]